MNRAIECIEKMREDLTGGIAESKYQMPSGILYHETNCLKGYSASQTRELVSRVRGLCNEFDIEITDEEKVNVLSQCFLIARKEALDELISGLEITPEQVKTAVENALVRFTQPAPPFVLSLEYFDRADELCKASYPGLFDRKSEYVFRAVVNMALNNLIGTDKLAEAMKSFGLTSPVMIVHRVKNCCQDLVDHGPKGNTFARLYLETILAEGYDAVKIQEQLRLACITDSPLVGWDKLVKTAKETSTPKGVTFTTEESDMFLRYLRLKKIFFPEEPDAELIMSSAQLIVEDSFLEVVVNKFQDYGFDLVGLAQSDEDNDWVKAYMAACEDGAFADEVDEPNFRDELEALSELVESIDDEPRSLLD